MALDDSVAKAYSFTLLEATIQMIVYGCLGISALVINTMIIAAIKLNRTFHTTGYAFLVSISIAETLALLVRVFLALPTSVAVLYGITVNDDYLRWIGEALMVVALVQTAHIFSVAINRYCSVLYFHKYPSLFTAKKTMSILVICWLIPILVFMARFYVGARYVYLPEVISWSGNTINNKFGVFFLLIPTYITSVLSVFCYTRVTLHIREMRRVMASHNVSTVKPTGERGVGRPRDELRLSFQFTLVTAVYVVTVVCLTIALTNPNLTAYKFPNILYNLMWMINYSINGFIYLLFNPKLRTAIRGVFRKDKLQFGPTSILK